MLAQTPDKDLAHRQSTTSEGMLEVTGALSSAHQAIFPVEAQTFLSELCAQFASRVDTLLAAREQKQSQIDQANCQISSKRRKIFAKEAGKSWGFRKICRIAA